MIFSIIDDEFLDEKKYAYNINDNFESHAYRKIYARIEQEHIGE